jgi:8-oxo-dGTP pyrophosphatase MutT (NUDIX family)
MPDEPKYRRRSARVLLIDAHDRLLLLRKLPHKRLPEEGITWWTPGGGIESGESLRQAAARELHEEVGLKVDEADLGVPIATRSGYAELPWARGVFRDDYFLYRVDRHEVDVSHQQDYELEMHAGHQWWTIPELATTTETIVTPGLVPLLTDLVAGRIPAEPVVLPWLA